MRYHEIVGEDVFHGSPHRFDKFSTDHMGSGEGAQVFGWGLYFTSEEEIADYYRSKLSQEEESDLAHSVTFDGKVVNGRTPSNQLTAEERAALAYYQNGYNTQRAIRDMEEWLEMRLRHSPETKDGAAFKMDMETIQALRTIDFTGRVKPYRGSFYHVEIPDSEDYLLWDQPISAQSPQVQAALIKTGIDIHDDHPTEWYETPVRWMLCYATPDGIKHSQIGYSKTPNKDGDWQIVTGFGKPLTTIKGTEKDARKACERMLNDIQPGQSFKHRSVLANKGKDAYKALSKHLGSDKAASLALAAHGIPGIKFKTGATRNRPDGEAQYNYVIFDDKNVKIKNVRNVNW